MKNNTETNSKRVNKSQKPEPKCDLEADVLCGRGGEAPPSFWAAMQNTLPQEFRAVVCPLYPVERSSNYAVCCER